MLALIESHDRKEEPITYRRAEVEVTETARTELVRSLHTGNTPPGWICERAAG